MSQCGRDPDEHCCWVAGKPCPYLRRTSRKVQKNDGFYWACQLRLELGSWKAVHQDMRYLADVQPVWEKSGIKDCGNWPEGENNPNAECTLCGTKAQIDG